MNKLFHITGVSAAALIFCYNGRVHAAEPPAATTHAPLHRALARLHMSRADLAMEADIKARDPFRIQRIDDFLLDPPLFPPFIQNLAQQLANTGRLDELARALPALLEFKCPFAETTTNSISAESLPQLLEQCSSSQDRQTWIEAGQDIRTQVKALPPDLARAFAVLTAGIAQAQAELKQLFPADWTDEQRQRFMQYARDLACMIRGSENEFPLDENWFQKAQTINLAAVFRAGALIAASVETATPLLRQYARTQAAVNTHPPWVQAISPTRRASSPRPLLSLMTPAGRFIIGGPGDDTYTNQDIALLIETGGDDRYLAPVGTGVDGIGISIDLAGNDVYQTDTSCALGCGCFGVGALMDMEGRDRYIAGDHALGTGIFGVGWLRDTEGDDTYMININGQGSGFFGLGALMDAAGNDMYWAGMFAQGIGHPKGMGLLLDRAGHDTYTLGGVIRGWAASQDYHMSGGQGFGCGIREYASGGFGLLIDLTGNDRYQSGASAQGAGYWYSIGAIMDGAGNDTYQCVHYGQATAFHYALGMLWDVSGNDRYLGGIATQAGSWDGGASIFIDQAGDDYYEAGGIANGGAAVTSLAIFLDHSGNDVYRNGPENAMGSASFDDKRGWGSIGIFIDSGGQDQYASSLFTNNSCWFQGDRGIGIDEEDRQPLWSASFLVKPVDTIRASAAAVNHAAVTHQAPTAEKLPPTRETAERLFKSYMKTTDPGAKGALIRQLQAMPEVALPVLSAALKARPFYLSWDGAYNAFPEMGPVAISTLATLTGAPDDNTRNRAIDCLGRIDDPATLPPILKALNDPSFWVRASAVSALGRKKHLAAIDAIIARLNDEHMRVRVQSAWALSMLGDPRGIAPLVARFADPLAAPREAAARALGKFGLPAMAAVKEKFEKGTAGDRALALVTATAWIAPDRSQTAGASLADTGWNMVAGGLADPDPAVRNVALNAMEMTRGEILQPQIKEALLKAIGAESIPSLKWRMEQLLARSNPQ